MPPKKAPPKLQVDTFGDHQIITQPNPLRTAVKRVAERDRDDPVARAEQALNELSDQFGDWMQKECERLSTAFEAVRKNGFNATTRDELFRAAHDIKGDAATFGNRIAECRGRQFVPHPRTFARHRERAARFDRAPCQRDPRHRARAQQDGRDEHGGRIVEAIARRCGCVFDRSQSRSARTSRSDSGAESRADGLAPHRCRVKY